MSDIMDDFFNEAMEQTEKVEKQQTGKSKRDARLLDIATPEGVTRVIYFRMFPKLTKNKDVKPCVFLPYKEYSFKSIKTGRPVYAGISPELYGQTDHFRSRQSEVWDINPDAGKLMYPNEKRLVNIHVIKDTHQPENDGEYKVLRYGAKEIDPKRPRSGSPFMKCFDKIFNDPDNEDIQRRDLYTLGENGVTFKMKITGGKIPDIEFDFFEKGKKVQGFAGLSREEQEKAYFEIAADLYEIAGEPFTEDVINKLIDTHLLCRESDNEPDISKESSNQSSYFGDDDEEDEIPDLGDTSDEVSDPDPASDAAKGKSNSGNSELDALLDGVL